MHDALLSEIQVFLADTGMGPTYFGVRSCGNSKLVTRLKSGRARVWPDTEIRIRAFMLAERKRLVRPPVSPPTEEVAS